LLFFVFKVFLSLSNGKRENRKSERARGERRGWRKMREKIEARGGLIFFFVLGVGVLAPTA